MTVLDSGVERPAVVMEPVLRADGLLGEFNRAGVLGYADVHVAARLRKLCGEVSEPVLLAAALAVRAVRQGSSCLALARVAETTAVDGLSPEQVAALPWPEPESWQRAVAGSDMVTVGEGGPPGQPLRLVDGLLYLDRYWHQEQVVAEYVDRAMLAPPTTYDGVQLEAALARLFSSTELDLQRLAAVVAAHRRLSIVAGGPGTGKTTTVARLIALLQDLAGGQLKVALAAPTGKAAARLTEAVAHATAELEDLVDKDRVGPLAASTLHRLLGSRRNDRTRFWHNRDNRLPYDVVVVDEASMVSLTMMSRLVEALRPSCRLVLVGDPNQLSSVEVGAVLGDLVERTPTAGVVPLDLEVVAPVDVGSLDAGGAAESGAVVHLKKVHRFSEEIQALAEAIRTGSVDGLEEVLAAGHPCLEFVEQDPGEHGFVAQSLRVDVVEAGKKLVEAARAGEAEAALDALERHRVLCGHREGPYGVARWGRQVQDWLSGAIDGYAADGLWYVGRPLLVTTNDYQLRLFNGDTGVVVASDDGHGRAAFRRDGAVELLATSRLSDVQTVHAMSVHRSQGSQFDRVTLVLPPAGSPLLTRELVYTAVTRAKEHVQIIGTREALFAAVQRPIQRASGLRRT